MAHQAEWTGRTSGHVVTGPDSRTRSHWLMGKTVVLQSPKRRTSSVTSWTVLNAKGVNGQAMVQLQNTFTGDSSYMRYKSLLQAIDEGILDVRAS